MQQYVNGTNIKKVTGGIMSYAIASFKTTLPKLPKLSDKANNF